MAPPLFPLEHPGEKCVKFGSDVFIGGSVVKKVLRKFQEQRKCMQVPRTALYSVILYVCEK
jgi:hypothetical protein